MSHSRFGLVLSILFLFLDKGLARKNRAKDFSTDQCQPGDYPSQVCILYVKNQQLCGGTIINPRHVLTSSFCFRGTVEQRNLKKKFVLAGDVTWGHVQTKWNQVRGISHLIQHPGAYREGFDLDDIAVLKLNQSFTTNRHVAPISLSAKPPKIGTQCVLLGWSQTGLARKAMNLRKGLVYIQRQIKCGGTLDDDDLRVICAADSGPTHTPCMVDYGGPLMCNDELAGVHSHSKHDCDNQTYGSYFMNVAFYREWIERVILWHGHGPEPLARAIRVSKATKRCETMYKRYYLFSSLLSYFLYSIWY